LAIRRTSVAWQTGIGGAGVSNFYSAFGVDVTAELGTFFNAIKALFPTAVTWDIPSAGDVLDEVSGLLTGAWTGGTAATNNGTLATAYAGGTGVFVRWTTNGIVGGRRVRGRTFLVPLATASYDTNGTVATATLTPLNAACATLVGAGKLQIWHRPTSPTSNDGSAHIVTGGTVPDKVTSLRTRRV
jgi:hypothetical protein